MTAVVMIPDCIMIFGGTDTELHTALYCVWACGIEYTSDSVIESNLGKSREIELDLQI